MPRRRFLSLSVRPSVYFALAGLFVAVFLWIDRAWIPHRRFDPNYLKTAATFAAPAALFLALGCRAAQRNRR